jgi:hypothetical protein
MRGSYKFYLDDKLVREQENIITNIGKIAILRFLASITNSYASSIAIGVSDITPTVLDKKLDFEIARSNIMIRSVNYDTSSILFKATFPVGQQALVKEIAVWPIGSDRSSMLFSFDDGETWTNQLLNTADIRIGAAGMKNVVLNGSSVENKSLLTLNLANLLLNDEFVLAFISYDDNCEYIRLSFTDINGDIIYSDFIPDPHISAGIQYQTVNVLKSSFTNQTKEWAQITEVSLITKAKSTQNTTIVLDGLRIEDSNTPGGSEIISRAILSSPILKEAGSSLDIEYVLGFSL